MRVPGLNPKNFGASASDVRTQKRAQCAAGRCRLEHVALDERCFVGDAAEAAARLTTPQIRVELDDERPRTACRGWNSSVTRTETTTLVARRERASRVL